VQKEGGGENVPLKYNMFLLIFWDLITDLLKS